MEPRVRRSEAASSKRLGRMVPSSARIWGINLEERDVYEKQKKLRYDKIKPDPYAKRTAARFAATPAPQSDRVAPASRTSEAGPSSLLEYPHSAGPPTHATELRHTPPQTTLVNRAC